MKKILFPIISIAIGLVLICLLGEGYCREFLDKRFLHYQVFNERNLFYRYDKELGWFPISGREGYYTGSRKIFVKNNLDGFRDRDHGAKERPRIMFLGDSFVWGYDVEQEERFTDKLQRLLPGYEIFNCGVSGYATDQEYLLLKRYFYRYKPDIVFLVFCSSNDYADNSNNNLRYGGDYYKPYFIIRDSRLALKGTPVPKTISYYRRERPGFFKSYLFNFVVTAISRINRRTIKVPDPTGYIVREMNDFLKTNNSKLIISSVVNDPYLESICKNNSIPYLSLQNPHRYPSHGSHWTPAGHDFVCKAVYDFLQKVE